MIYFFFQHIDIEAFHYFYPNHLLSSLWAGMHIANVVCNMKNLLMKIGRKNKMSLH